MKTHESEQNSHARIFAQAMQRYGGSFDTNTLDPIYRPLLRDTSDRINALIHRISEINKHHEPLPPIYLGFISDDSPRAFVINYQGYYLIAISVGIVEQLYGTLYGLLSDPQFFSHIGDVAKEEPIKDDLSNGFPIFPMRAASNPDTKSVLGYLPECELRSAYALIVGQSALDFLAAHECAHIFGGHFDYIQRTGPTNIISDDDLFNPPSKIELDRVLLEVDSDAFACDLAHTLHLNDTIGQLFLDDGMVIDRDASSAATEAWSLAVLVMFRLFFSGATTSDPMIDGYYAHPAVRSVMLLQHLLSPVSDPGISRWPDIIDGFRKTVYEVEEVWRRLQLPGFAIIEREEWNQKVQTTCSFLYRKLHERLPDIRKSAKVIT